MNRGILPFVLILIAIGLFVVYTNPAYQETKSLSTQLASYDDALNQSTQVLKLRDQLLEKRNALSADDVNKLQLLLPDNIDNIRLIIDINDIAARYHLQVQGISVGSTEAASAEQTSGVGGNASAVGSVTLSFSVNASYAEFLAFLHDLEHSLRLIDVTSIAFSATGKDLDSYSLTINTYWLK